MSAKKREEEKELSTKLHEGIKKDIHEGARRTAKGPLRRWRMLERDPPRVGRGEGVKTTWERGRPARTNPGTMEENPVKAGLVRLAREWPWMAGCLQE